MASAPNDAETLPRAHPEAQYLDLMRHIWTQGLSLIHI